MHRTLHETGLSEEEIFNSIHNFRKDDHDWQSGRTFGFVYYPGDEAARILRKSYDSGFFENGLNPAVFRSLRQMECEVVSMSASLLHGPPESVGNLTSGGTESILCAMKAAKKHHGGKCMLNTVLPSTAHPAFNKAADILDVEVRTIRNSGDTYLPDLDHAASLIDENTIMLAGSAPCFPFGQIDPLGEMNQLAREKNVWLHVDACMGGFILPFLEQTGEKIPVFDFRLPGVRSISADIHKYGYGAKGTSVVLFRNSMYRKKMYFVYTEWPGGLYASPTITGTRPGGAIVSAWAIMNYLGMSGYREMASKTLQASREIMSAINSTGELRIVGNPEATVFAFVSSGSLDVYELGDKLHERGWYLDKQLSPPSLHMTISAGNTACVGDFIHDLRESVKELQKRHVRTVVSHLRNSLLKRAVAILPGKLVKKIGSKAIKKIPDHTSEKENSAPMYGMMGKLTGTDALQDIILNFLDEVYRPAGASFSQDQGKPV